MLHLLNQNIGTTQRTWFWELGQYLTMAGQTGQGMVLMHKPHTHIAADSLPTRPSRSCSLVPSSTPWSSAVLTTQIIHPALCVCSGGAAFPNKSAARGGLCVFPGSVLDGQDEREPILSLHPKENRKSVKNGAAWGDTMDTARSWP